MDATYETNWRRVFAAYLAAPLFAGVMGTSCLLTVHFKGFPHDHFWAVNYGGAEYVTRSVGGLFVEVWATALILAVIPGAILWLLLHKLGARSEIGFALTGGGFGLVFGVLRYFSDLGMPISLLKVLLCVVVGALTAIMAQRIAYKKVAGRLTAPRM